MAGSEVLNDWSEKYQLDCHQPKKIVTMKIREKIRKNIYSG